VGQTSGAYAYIAEGLEWTSYSRVAGDNRLSRTGRGAAGADYDAAKSDYGNDPSYYKAEWVIDCVIDWSCRYYALSPPDDYYSITGQQTYLSFDTSGVSKVSAAKFSVSVSDVLKDGTEENPTLYIYKQDWTNSYDSGDWYGGTLIAQREFTIADEGNTVEIEIDPSDVTTGDISKYRFTFGRIASPGYWPDPAGVGENEQIRNRLDFTTVTLKIK
ncbi:unnamed protein product, partial [marine sediment metagenome]